MTNPDQSSETEQSGMQVKKLPKPVDRVRSYSTNQSGRTNANGMLIRGQHGLLSSSLVRNGLPAMVGAFAAAATGGIAAVPALGISLATGLGYAWLSSHNQPS